MMPTEQVETGQGYGYTWTSKDAKLVNLTAEVYEMVDESRCKSGFKDESILCQDLYFSIVNHVLANNPNVAQTDPSQQALFHLKEPAPYSPEAIFERVRGVRERRTVQYNSSRIRGHKHLGVVWTGILNGWLFTFCSIEIPTIPGWVTALLMAALKLSRISIAPGVEDSYDDAINYCAIAEENAHSEGVLD